MVIKKKIKTKTSVTTGIVIFGAFAGVLTAIAFGPVSGLIVAVAGIAGGIIGGKNEMIKKANTLLPDDKLLEEAKEIHKKTGDNEIRFRIERENKNKDIPFLGRLTYGDRETFEKIYYFDKAKQLDV